MAVVNLSEKLSKIQDHLDTLEDKIDETKDTLEGLIKIYQDAAEEASEFKDEEDSDEGETEENLSFFEVLRRIYFDEGSMVFARKFWRPYGMYLIIDEPDPSKRIDAYRSGEENIGFHLNLEDIASSDWMQIKKNVYN
jgi:hypothetical protein